MARPARRPANQECRVPVVYADLDELELDGLQDFDGWSERAVRGSAIAADAEHVTFGRCKITGVRFTAASLRKAELTDVILVDCDLSGAVLEELSLNRVSFTGCRLSGADLGGASLIDVSFNNCQMDEAAFRMVRAERLVATGCAASGLDLYRAVVAGSRWHDTDLTGADLSGARLTGARLHGSTLIDVRGAKALEGAVIDPDQAFVVGMALIADARIEIDDER